uniref:Uncharacterized protein n=1 Tax=Anguilla anguilla TaxID=7936 RepID=A0A0E9PLP3_ANGAN
MVMYVCPIYLLKTFLSDIVSVRPVTVSLSLHISHP